MIDINKILNHLDDIIVIKDESGNIIYNNKPYEHFTGIINNNITGEKYIKEQKEWVNITNKEIFLDNNKYEMITIKNITKYKKREKFLVEESISDKLTGIYNRQGIDCGLVRSIEQFEKSERPFTIVMGDIDNFKHINDTYGHAAGDKVLCGISSIIKNNIRRDDFVGRYGGEEFLIVFATDNIDQIKQRIEHIRKEIENHVFRYKDQFIQLTITFGLQLYNGEKKLETVIDEADQALYYGKQHGRNQLNVYNDIKNDINQNKKNR